MNFGRLLHTEFGRTLISIILGLGLASLFRRVCNDKDCIVFKSENLKDVSNKTFKEGDKCYMFDYNVDKCNSVKKIVKV